MPATQKANIIHAAVVALMLAAACPASAQSYIYTTLNYPGTGTRFNFPYASDINNSGQIVSGYSDEALGTYAYLYTPGSGQTTLSFPHALSIVADGINNSGQIVGQYMDDTNYLYHGFVYTPGVGLITLDAPDASTQYGYPSTSASDINDSGQIVGTYYDGTNDHGFLYTPEGGFTTLDDPLAGAYSTSVSGINDAGQIVGNYFDGTSLHGFLYTLGSGFTTLDDPEAKNTIGTSAYGINDAGQIVGEYGGGYGFVYTPGSGYTTLDYPQATTTYLSGINNSGQIVGGYSDSAQFYYAFTAAPVPEASSLVSFAVLTVLGVGGMLIAARKRHSQRKLSGI